MAAMNATEKLLNSLTKPRLSELHHLHKTGATSKLHEQLKLLGLTKMGERAKLIGALHSMEGTGDRFDDHDQDGPVSRAKHLMVNEHANKRRTDQTHHRLGTASIAAAAAAATTGGKSRRHLLRPCCCTTMTSQRRSVLRCSRPD